MNSRNNPPTAALKPWRASIFRKRLRRLGRICAVDRATAENVAVEEFRLSENERSRLLIEKVR
jgi:hypothetical protein